MLIDGGVAVMLEKPKTLAPMTMTQALYKNLSRLETT